MKLSTDRLAYRFFLLSIALFVFGYGVFVGRNKIFPYKIIDSAARGLEELRTNAVCGDKLPQGYRKAKEPRRPAIFHGETACEGVNLVVECTADRRLLAKIMDLDGKTLHRWDLNWFELWPDATHVPARLMPKSQPGTFVHGCVLLENGDLVFSFDHLGLMRIDRAGKIVWRIPYQTHHSVHLHDDGNLWVCGEKEHTEWSSRFPNRVPPYEEFTLLEVTQDGEIKNEWSVAEILRKNGLTGLLYLCSIKSRPFNVRGDVLHLNDVEPFPNDMKEGFFKKGDVLVSLRNVNTIFAFNRDTEKVKFVCTGRFVRQHDPDFIDGDTFSVFDNNALAPEDDASRSRILLVSAPDQKVSVVFEGNPKAPFYTRVAGRNQWLPNGNILITETKWGRAFEINREGEIVWEYVNYVDDQTIGWVGEVQRFPPEYVRLYDGSESAGSKETTESRTAAKEKQTKTDHVEVR
jgi:hypothetical protein